MIGLLSGRKINPPTTRVPDFYGWELRVIAKEENRREKGMLSKRRVGRAN